MGCAGAKIDCASENWLASHSHHTTPSKHGITLHTTSHHTTSYHTTPHHATLHCYNTVHHATQHHITPRRATLHCIALLQQHYATSTPHHTTPHHTTSHTHAHLAGLPHSIIAIPGAGHVPQQQLISGFLQPMLGATHAHARTHTHTHAHVRAHTNTRAAPSACV